MYDREFVFYPSIEQEAAKVPQDQEIPQKQQEKKCSLAVKNSSFDLWFLYLGWTSSGASTYCSDRITSSSAYRVCRNLVSSSLSYTQSCIADLLFSGNSRIASLHLKNLQEDCRQVIETDKSLALSTSAKEDILDSLCLSSCSGHGTCQQGQ